MKLLMAQLNYTVGDFAGNTGKILDVINKHGNDVDMIIFSELCLSGYYPKDLLLKPAFIEQQFIAMERVIQLSRKVSAAIVIGYIARNHFPGKSLLNSLALIENGQILYRYHKQLLPVYGVFDEARHFEPGTQPGLYEWRGQRLGFLICEDGWQSDKDAPLQLYRSDPVDALCMSNLDLVISINASPGNIGKHQIRHDLVKNIAARTQAPVVYVNQVGGIDDLVFDGGSVAFNADGQSLGQGAYYAPSSTIIDLASDEITETTALADIELIANQLRLGLADYCRKTGFKKVVVGSSGGIDSAVTLALATWALGSENVTAITMPSRYSSLGSISDSQKLCDNLGVKLHKSSIEESFAAEVTAFHAAFGKEPSGITKENIQARLRGLKLMAYSNHTNALLLSTGNKSELAVGYCTLYGDMSGGLNLLGDLYKLEVYALAGYLNEIVFKRNVIPEAVIKKAPSAELAPGQRDADALPPYDQLDAVLKLYLEKDLLAPAEQERLIAKIAAMDPKEIQRVCELVEKNEYKRRQAAPAIRVNRRAFGFDRQIPITAKLSQPSL